MIVNGPAESVAAKTTPNNTGINEKVISDPSLLKEYAKQYGFKLKKGDLKLNQIVFHPLSDTTSTSVPQTTNNILGTNSTITSQWAVVPYYYISISSKTDFAATAVLHSTYGYGPATLSQIVNQSVAVQYSFNGGITVAGVSEGLGYSITKGISISDSISLPLQSGQSGEIDSHVMYHRTNFNVMYCPVIGSDYKTGSGHSDKPYGIAFATYIN
jgi:hypothetical protein